MPRALKIIQDNLLDDVEIASPCPAEWKDMVGSDTVRFCASCQKNVYNLSGMGRGEAADLLRATEGRLCVRFFRRADGTILTDDCPVGVAAVLKRAKRMTLAAAALSVGAVAALLAILGGSLTKKTCQRLNTMKDDITNIEPVQTMGEPAEVPQWAQGEIAPVPPPLETVGARIPVEAVGNLKPPRPEPSQYLGRDYSGNIR